MVLKQLLYFVFLMLLLPQAYAFHYYHLTYKTEYGESVTSVLKKFVKDEEVSNINLTTPLLQKTMASNPHVKNWKSLPPYTTIELYISDDFMDLSKYRDWRARGVTRLAVHGAMEPMDEEKGIFKGSLFYMSSLGNFAQKSADLGEVTYQQNSPASFGGAFSMYPEKQLYSVSASAYISYLNAAGNTLTEETVSIPPEIGGNIYGEYRLQNYDTTIYAGPDYEKFSTFNLAGMQTDRKVYVDGVGATYLTFGLAKSFSMFDKVFFTKLSLSRTLLTSYQSSYSEVSEKYSGYRYLFYLNYKFSPKMYLHTLLKYHTLSGSSNVSSFRIGIGLGYILF